MIPLMVQDMFARPDLFHMAGRVGRDRVELWATENALRLPRELLDMWATVGGGDFFETETLLSPIATTELGDDVVSVNAYHRARGMPGRYIVFHVGAGGLSACDQDTGLFCQLDPACYAVGTAFDTLAAWYTIVLHNEYAARYGLP